MITKVFDRNGNEIKIQTIDSDRITVDLNDGDTILDTVMTNGDSEKCYRYKPGTLVEDFIKLPSAYAFIHRMNNRFVIFYTSLGNVYIGYYLNAKMYYRRLESTNVT